MHPTLHLNARARGCKTAFAKYRAMLPDGCWRTALQIPCASPWRLLTGSTECVERVPERELVRWLLGTPFARMGPQRLDQSPRTEVAHQFADAERPRCDSVAIVD